MGIANGYTTGKEVDNHLPRRVMNNVLPCRLIAMGMVVNGK